jgi:hypothetical protein
MEAFGGQPVTRLASLRFLPAKGLFSAELVSRVAGRQRRLHLPGLRQIVLLNRQVELLRCLDIAVARQLLDDVNGQLAGPVRDAGPAEIGIRKSGDPCLLPQRRQPPVQVVD